MNTNPHAGETSSSLANSVPEKPLSIGELLVLKTKAEVEARFQPIKAYITTVPASRASVTVKAVDNALREVHSDSAQSLQHLRRFVKFEHLPEHINPHSTGTFPTLASGAHAHQENNGDQIDGSHSAASDQASLLLLICATTDLSIERICALHAPDSRPLWKGEATPIISITVPGRPPTSEIQAKQWSQQYWPTIYKKHNPFGAHPSIVSRATAEVEEDLDKFMDLASEAAHQVADADVGERVGAVVVDRSDPENPIVVMAAGDARWNLTRQDPEQKSGGGNVMAHAVMRAIALVASKRREISSNPATMRSDNIEDVFTDFPLTPLEIRLYAMSDVKPDGYLCLDFEFYLTHEPCVMCSMALLHSRAGRVVFEKKMVHTGGLTAGEEEGQAEVYSGLGYGLFWRPSLNWKFLTWQWNRAVGFPLQSLETMHA